jgi:dihydrofolate reductase
MKVILYMATTANGLIAKLDDSADFLTQQESQSYVSTVVVAGALIIGRRTYEVLSKQSEFQEFLKAKVKVVVVSYSAFEVKDPSHVVARSPGEALAVLKECETVIVAGGGKLNSSFLAEKLIDELYLDVEPSLLGKGIPLFDGADFECSLKLLDVKRFGEDEVQLHYQIVE